MNITDDMPDSLEDLATQQGSDTHHKRLPSSKGHAYKAKEVKERNHSLLSGNNEGEKQNASISNDTQLSEKMSQNEMEKWDSCNNNIKNLNKSSSGQMHQGLISTIQDSRKDIPHETMSASSLKETFCTVNVFKQKNEIILPERIEAGNISKRSQYGENITQECKKGAKNIQQLNKFHSPRANHTPQETITNTREPWGGQGTYQNNNFFGIAITPEKINMNMTPDVMSCKDTSHHAESTNKIQTDV